MNTFASHISRKHRGADDSVLDDFVLDKSVTAEPLPEPSELYPEAADEDVEPEVPLSVDEILFFLRNLMLKLQSKLLLLASTIQTIIEDFQNAHELGQLHSLNILRKRLEDLGIPHATISSIIDEMNRGSTHTP